MIWKVIQVGGIAVIAVGVFLLGGLPVLLAVGIGAAVGYVAGYDCGVMAEANALCRKPLVGRNGRRR